MLLSNDGGFRGALTRPVAAAVPWRLDSSGPERLPKTVYARFGESGANYTDDIILDETSPTVAQATIGGGAVARRRAYRLTLRASDRTSGVARLQWAARRGRSDGSAAYRRSVTVRASKRPRHLRVQDRAGNWSAWKALRTSPPESKRR